MKNLNLIRVSLRPKGQNTCADCKTKFSSWWVPTYSDEQPKILITKRCESCFYKPEGEFFDKHAPLPERDWIDL